MQFYNRFRSTLSNHFSMAAIALALISLAPSLANAETIAWWRGEFDGGGLINDASSGPSLNAVTQATSEQSAEVAGPFILDPVNGKTYPNQASYINGLANYTGSRIEEVATLVAAMAQGSFTVEAIVKADNSNGGYQLLIGQAIPQADGFAFGTNSSNQLRFGASQADGTYLQALGDVIPDNEWFRVAAVGVWNGTDTQVSLYVNGSLVGEKTFDGGLMITPFDAFFIGSKNPWNGPIDELRISNEALSPEKFLQIATSDKAK